MKLCPKCQKQFSDDANFCPVDAARLVPLEGQPAAPADPLTERFQMGPALGGARTGPVHRALDRQTNAAAVVKIISPAVVALPGVAQRIERELKQLELVQSVGVAKVLASGRRGEDWWVATDLVDGAQTLAAAITARGPLPLEDAAHLIEVIGEALIEAAQVGVVHRDLAPKNVLFAGSEIKLINFSVPVPTDTTPGVPEFVAPEQVEGKAVDQRSNLYSLGALFYYVLTGQPVYTGTPDEVLRAHVNGTIASPSTLMIVPGPVETVIMRALDKSPTKRFLTVRQFVDEVGRVSRGDGESSVRSTLPMGKAGRPRAELVQTLLGVRGSGISAAVMQAAVKAAAAQAAGAAAAPAGAAAAAAAASAAAAPAAAPAPFMPPGAVPAISGELPAGATMHGVGSGAAIPVPETQGVQGAQGAQGAVVHGEVVVAPKPAPMEAPPMVAPVAAAPGDRSPWAAPAGQPAAASPQAAAAPTPAAAAAAAPAPTAKSTGPSSASATVSHKKKGDKGKSDKGKGKGKGKSSFRETLWFKKGELDAQAAEERAKSGRDTGSGQAADSLPMDERYKDDGSLSHGDKEKYSLRTGGTEVMPRLRDSGVSSADVSEDELIGEMKAGRGKILALVGIGLVVLILIIVFVAR
ncbi:MAG TPA: serine/threonine-protein kinase [Kofleriaceae bacterium]|nr:serine/threonine-protein kinase [Kofleriaceae bacterium]